MVLLITARKMITKAALQRASSRAFANEASSGEHQGEDLKEGILRAVLENQHVSRFGWSTEAVAAGCVDLGLSPLSHGMFPRGGLDLAYFFMESATKKSDEELTAKSLDDRVFASMQSNQKIREALFNRLEKIAPVKDSWPQAMAMGAQPQNIPSTLVHLENIAKMASLHSAVEGVPSGEGDVAKRATLVAVYTSAELFMLSDQSPDHVATWDFIGRRLNNLSGVFDSTEGMGDVAMAVGGGLSSVSKAMASLLVPAITQNLPHNPVGLFMRGMQKPPARNPPTN